MWSYVGKKAEPRWLGTPSIIRAGRCRAYVFGRRKDQVFLQLRELLEPFGITRFYTDGWGAYERHLAPEQHMIGKAHTQKIESKHINLRTRIKRLMRRSLADSLAVGPSRNHAPCCMACFWAERQRTLLMVVLSLAERPRRPTAAAC